MADTELRLDMPSFAAIEWTLGFPVGKEWLSAVTTTESGQTSEPAEIVDQTIPVEVPDDFVGQFDVCITASDGTRCLAATCYRFPPLTNGADD